jgi:acyl transferase domain-containing protein/acyl carrier protein
MTEYGNNNHLTGLEIAVIGMSGRFPRADNVAEFWDNIKNGVECLSFYSSQELQDLGVSEEVIDDPSYVNAEGGLLDKLGYFDAFFFDYNPVEAKYLDLQVRLFHECAWEALEDSGYMPNSFNGLIGVYAGAEDNIDWKTKAFLSQGEGESEFTRLFLSNKDFMSTRISYKLNLTGPSYTISTGCSTALVSIHLACRNLLSGECDLALAGGVRIKVPMRNGYVYEEGMLLSKDGHLRAFDERASGTAFSSGIGVVILKTLEEAMADQDHIYAVIKGSAVNNDGNRKVNFAAPSVKGQIEVIKAAHQMAEINPATVSYVETHGTGTPLGDPIEISALTQAFDLEPGVSCPIGSVKTNVGHMDVAAGAVGFIKTVLVLKHKLVPPNLHFETPNPKIDFENSPFYVNTRLQELKSNGGLLRATVSSFGFGGTNAHAVLEEAPERELSSPSREFQLLMFSAKTPQSLDGMTRKMADFLKAHPLTNLADAAYSLQLGRDDFQFRRMMLCADMDEAITNLEAVTGQSLQIENPGHFSTPGRDKRSVVFMFSGHGSLYVNMGLDIYRSEPLFREEMDRCFTILEGLGYPVKEILYPHNEQEDMADKLKNIIYGGPIKFLFEYSLAKLLMHWGVQPDAMIGYSFGEYVAACLAGVFSLEDALKLVLIRGKLMSTTSEGTMLSVSLSEEQLTPLLNENLTLAGVNSSGLCSISGPSSEVAAFEKQLIQEGHQCIPLKASHAYHSNAMLPILKEFEENVALTTRREPTIPYISTVSGDWITTAEATDPDYWSRHILDPVRFSDGLEKLLSVSNAIFLQIGPDRGLPLFVNQHHAFKTGQLAVNMVRHYKEKISDQYYLLHKLGALWGHGVKIDWSAFYQNEVRHRIPMPTYSFHRRRYWIKETLHSVISQLYDGSRFARKKNVSDWLYSPSWKRTLSLPASSGQIHDYDNILIFNDNTGLGDELVTQLIEKGKEGCNVVFVSVGQQYNKVDPKHYSINPQSANDYNTLLKDLQHDDCSPGLILHFWGVTGSQNETLTLDTLNTTLNLGFYSLFNLAQAIGEQGINVNINIKVITDNMQEVLGIEKLQPAKSTVLAAVNVLPLEYPNITCNAIDIVLPGSDNLKEGTLATRILPEILSESLDRVIAIRANHRWIRTFEPIQPQEPADISPLLKERGVYLITGGLGGIGFVLADYLAKSVQAKLILIGRSTLPPKESWPQWLEQHDHEDSSSEKIRKVMALESHGSEVLISGADIADFTQMEGVLNHARQQFGVINGIIHCAGLVDYAGVVQRRTREMTDNVLAPKVNGTIVLDQVTRNDNLDFFVLCSSLAALVPSFGEIGYMAANIFLDSFAHYNTLKTGTYTVSVNWDTWREVGAAVEAFNKRDEKGKEARVKLKEGILSQEGIDAFSYILETPSPQVVVSTKDLDMILAQFQPSNEDAEGEILASKTEIEETQSEENLRPRPELSTPYLAPSGDIEKNLIKIWQAYFGIGGLGVNDDFFELGGDSLMAITLRARMQKGLEVNIPLSEIFNTPNIKKLAQFAKSLDQEVLAPIEPVEMKEYYPISSAEKRLYILYQLDPQRLDYNETMTISLEGNFELERFRNCFTRLVETYEILRTSFTNVEDIPVQRIADPQFVTFDIEQFEVDENVGLTGTGDIMGTFIRPFDLGKAPLFRVGIIKFTENHHLFMLDWHHIIVDRVTLGRFMADFATLYDGHELAPVTIHYKDYASWQNNEKQGQVMKQQEQYWLQVFSNEPEHLSLPYDFKRTGSSTMRGDCFIYSLNNDDTLGLRRIAAKEKVSMNMLLISVLNVLFAKVSGQQDIVLGLPTSGRYREDLEPIMGLFVNTLAVRNFPEKQKKFSAFLSDVKQTVLQAFENQMYQFEDLVQKVSPNREDNKNPLFDVMFQFDNIELPDIEMSQLKLKGVPNKKELSKFDLTFFARELDDHIGFTIEYSVDLFKIETIKLFIDYLQKIISAVILAPDILISEIKIISDGSQENMLDPFYDDLEDE